MPFMTYLFGCQALGCFSNAENTCPGWDTGQAATDVCYLECPADETGIATNIAQCSGNSTCQHCPELNDAVSELCHDCLASQPASQHCLAEKLHMHLP